MAEIYLVRHTKVNIQQGICYGITDVPLAPSFPNEFMEIKNKLGGKKFTLVYTSPLSRCIKLADFLSPNKFIKDNRLMELNFGEWEMKQWNDIFLTPHGKQWMENYEQLPCPAGESYPELFTRVSTFINSLNKTDDKLIITHSGVIRVFLSVFKNKSLQDCFMYPVNYGEVIKLNNQY